MASGADELDDRRRRDRARGHRDVLSPMPCDRDPARLPAEAELGHRASVSSTST
jgi:hypothetical protein